MLKTGKRLIPVCILFLISVVGISQKKTDSSPFFFIQVSDPQFGMFDSNAGFTKETELYEKAVNEINRLKPDFVVVTGDLVNNKDDRGQVEEFKRITSNINPEISVYYSPGNHDIGQLPAQEDIDKFISDFGHDRFSFMHKNSFFVGLNSCILKSDNPILEQLQFEWIKGELTKNKSAAQIIIFSHYPFFIKEYDEPDTYSNIPFEIRIRYLTLFNENNVDAIFAGHLHDNSMSEYESLDMITTSAVGKPLGKTPSGIRIVKVYSDRIESNYYGLDEIPESVVFLP